MLLWINVRIHQTALSFHTSADYSPGSALLMLLLGCLDSVGAGPHWPVTRYLEMRVEGLEIIYAYTYIHIRIHTYTNLRQNCERLNVQQTAEKEHISRSCVYLPDSLPKPPDSIPANATL